MGGSILGASVKRVEDPRFVTGAGRYLPNRLQDGVLWAVFVRSPDPHGVLGDVDVDEARTMPGVVGIFTAADFEGLRMPADVTDQPDVTRRPLVAGDRVRFVGDILAVVVAASHREAVDAADLVWADIDPLPAVADLDAALGEDAPLLFPEHGSNVVVSGGMDTDGDVLEGADVVIRARVVHQRLAAVPLEPNSAFAVPHDDGSVEVWCGTQNVFSHRNEISKAIGLDRNLITVRVTDMGGGFGAKIATYPEQALVTALALRLGRPVRWSETRTEAFQAMSQGRAQVHDAELGARRDGTIVGLRVLATQDAGAYPLFGAEMPTLTQRMMSGPYRIPAIDFRWRSAVTNTTPIHAYRGAGRPEATFTIERLVDLLAAELGIDPVEIRRRNLIPANAFPYVTATGERYDSGDYEAALDLALEMAGYEDLRREQEERRTRGDRVRLGIGVSCYTEVTAPFNRKEWGRVEVHEDGSVTAYSGSSAHGQGHETTFAQLVSSVLGVPLDHVRLVQGDSARIARGTGTMGSRSLQLGGTTVLGAATTVLEKAKRIVAHRLEAGPEDVVVFEPGRLGIAGVPDSSLGWGEIARLADDPSALPEGMEPGLSAIDVRVQAEATVPFGAHVSVAEVDTETGDVRLRRHVACDDCGTIVNRMVVDGQVHGGIAQGVGAALFEQVSYDEDANPLTGNLTSYLVPTATTLPRFEIDHTQTPTPENPLGAKGIGESGTIGSTPAVASAVLDALAPFGIRHLDMPLTSARIWSALHERT